jgi:hypothetical protein
MIVKATPAERVRPLVQACEAEQPRGLLERWQQLSAWVGHLGEP